MELNSPEERIAAAIWSTNDPAFRDGCTAIRLYVEREISKAKFDAYNYLATKQAHDQANVLHLWDLIRRQRDEVDQIEIRIRFLEAQQKNIRPIR